MGKYDPSAILDAVASVARAKPAQTTNAPATSRTVLYATVMSLDGNGRPRLTFDGETTTTATGWYRNANYLSPTAGDRVAVLPDWPGARSGLVLCKVA